jgi:hypothetical protein
MALKVPPRFTGVSYFSYFFGGGVLRGKSISPPPPFGGLAQGFFLALFYGLIS